MDLLEGAGNLAPIIRELGALGMVAAFLVGLYTRKIRWGKDYEDVEKQRDEYKAIVDIYHSRLESRVRFWEEHDE